MKSRKRAKPANYPTINSILIFAVALATYAQSFATPQLASYAGNRCSTCHVEASGSGMRNDFGWNFGRDVALFHPKAIGIDELYALVDKDDYAYFDGIFAAGADLRFQTVRSHKTDQSKRVYYPMQASVYAALTPFEWISVSGRYNFGRVIFPGQQTWTTAISLKPSESFPSLRFGHLQPALGFFDCDMTAFDRRLGVVDGSKTLFPPYYAEYGVELTYESLDWLTLIIGAYSAENLKSVWLYGGDESMIRSGENDDPIAYSAAAAIYPEFLSDDLPSASLGGAYYLCKDFQYFNFFVKYNIVETLSVSAYFAHSQADTAQRSANYGVEIVYVPINGVFAGVRAERGETTINTAFASKQDFPSYQAVAYLRVIPLPYIEIIPEYRFLDCLEYASTRWAFQLHFYY